MNFSLKWTRLLKRPARRTSHGQLPDKMILNIKKFLVGQASTSEQETKRPSTGFGWCGRVSTYNQCACTELTTVFEILNQSELIRKELQLETVVVVINQSLYAKATEITWRQRNRFSKILLRMGTFNTICNTLGIIYKRFRDAGLKYICIESGIVASG